MIWFAIAFLVAVAIGLVYARREIAQMQSLVMGGRVGGPGCVLAQAIILLAIAVLMIVFRREF